MPNSISRWTITKGDTRTPIARTLTQGAAAVDLTGLTVKFQMVNEAGTVVIAETATNVTIVTPSAGQVQFAFTALQVATAGIYYGWFTVYNGSARDTFPNDGRRLIIEIVEAA